MLFNKEILNKMVTEPISLDNNYPRQKFIGRDDDGKAIVGGYKLADGRYLITLVLI